MKILNTVLVTFCATAAGSLMAATEEELLEDGLPRGLPLNQESVEKDYAGWGIYFDNDILVPGSDRDQDYTSGLGVVIAGASVKDNWVSLDAGLNAIDSWLGVDELHGDNETKHIHTQQFGIQLFTPDNSSAVDIALQRPYANMLFVSNSQSSIQGPLDPAYQSTFTVGLLGTRIGEQLQNGIHKLTGSEEELGWDKEISNGGEPTFQYSFARHDLLSSNFQQDDTEYELKYTTELSVGYITQASISLSGRWGAINTPWWSFAPEAGSYLMTSTPVVGDSTRKDTSELYLWYGAEVTARAYNVFLQGQFRDSARTFEASQLEPIIGEAWVGLTSQFDEYRLSYVLRYQTKEIKSEFGGDNLLWAGVQLVNLS